MKRFYVKTRSAQLRCPICRQDFPSKRAFGSHCQPRQGKRGTGATLCRPI